MWVDIGPKEFNLEPHLFWKHKMLFVTAGGSESVEDCCNIKELCCHDSMPQRLLTMKLWIRNSNDGTLLHAVKRHKAFNLHLSVSLNKSWIMLHPTKKAANKEQCYVFTWKIPLPLSRQRGKKDLYFHSAFHIHSGPLQSALNPMQYISLIISVRCQPNH